MPVPFAQGLADGEEFAQVSGVSAIPVEKPLPGSLMFGTLLSSACAIVLAASCVAVTVHRIQSTAQLDQRKDDAIAQIDRESAIRQAAFERYAQEGSGVTLRDYVCHPTQPPVFDAVPWARPNEDWPVYDSRSVHIGNIKPDGTYRHFGYCG